MEFFLWFIIQWLWMGIGITAFYHRKLTHRGFDCPRWLEYIFVTGGYLSMQGAPIPWVYTHKLHHRYSDTDRDPHTPKKGFYYSLLSWIWSSRSLYTEEQINKEMADLIKDPYYKFLGVGRFPARPWLNLSSCILYRLIILFLFGPTAFLASMLAWVMVFFAPQLVNTFCHLPKFGYKSHKTKDDSVNVWWVALLSFGEGWHENHHFYPRAAKHGRKWWEFDITWLFIQLLGKLKLASNIRKF